MATAASFPSLHAPAAEDNMEMSSPANPAYNDDDDIDIDFDDHPGGVELTDDERMIEDNEQPRPGTATDDMMEDDASPPQEGIHVPEQEMQDDFDAAAYEQADPDDELIDYGDDEYQDVTESHDHADFEPSAPEITVGDPESADLEFEEVDDEVARQPEASVHGSDIAVVEEAVVDQVPHPEDAGLTDPLPTTSAESAPAEPEVEPVPAAEHVSSVKQSPAIETERNVAESLEDESAQAEAELVPTGDEQGEAATARVDEQQENDLAATAVEEPFPELPQESPEQLTSVPAPAPLDTSLDAGVDAPGTPTDTGLHPMMVQYGDWEWPLFKSKKQPEGLLKDDNLASVALADLLNSCRYRLALKVGEDIPETQEFVLRFDGMGLSIIEVRTRLISQVLTRVYADRLHRTRRRLSTPVSTRFLRSTSNCMSMTEHRLFHHSGCTYPCNPSSPATLLCLSKRLLVVKVSLALLMFQPMRCRRILKSITKMEMMTQRCMETPLQQRNNMRNNTKDKMTLPVLSLLRLITTSTTHLTRIQKVVTALRTNTIAMRRPIRRATTLLRKLITPALPSTMPTLQMKRIRCSMTKARRISRR